MKLEKILSPKLEATYLTFGRSDNEIVGIQNWSSGQNKITFYDFDGKKVIPKQKIMNDDGRTVDGMVMFEEDLLVFESGGKPYSGLIQTYQKKNETWTKTHSYPTLNFIEEPSIKNGIIAGTEYHDHHGFLLSLYDMNYAPKNILTKKLPNVMSNLVWLPQTNHLAAESNNRLMIYVFDAQNTELTKFGQHENINFTLHNYRMLEREGENNISSILATKNDELLLGITSKDKRSKDGKSRGHVILTTSLMDNDTLTLQGKLGEIPEIDIFNDLVLSPSEKFLMTYEHNLLSPINCNIYSVDFCREPRYG